MSHEDVVGEVVGSVSSLPESSGTVRYTPSSAQWDVAIGGLPFQKAVSDDFPYARETAEFRRQQYDQSSIPGDQSLTGFWTRGQFSFHRGAGVNYYELTDGETVLNRFNDSDSVDPWTPGQVTLRPPVSEVTSTASEDVVLFDDDLALLRSDGAIYQVTYAGTETALALTGAGSSTSICTDGVNLYATNGAKIDKCTPGGSFTTLFTHPGPKNFAYVWWAKSRLWMLDVDGGLYVKAPTGSLTSGELLWTAPVDDTYRWSLAESDGAVFLAAKDTIWSSTVDASTATPALGGPVTVGRIGAQETIGTIGEYLGYLIVASSAGVRIARIGDGILLGDLVVEGDSSLCSRMAYRKSLALVTGSLSSSVALWELDLLEQVSDLSPAFAPVRDLGSVASDPHGSFVIPDGRVGYFGSSGIFLEDESLGSGTGTLRTGFHRFGTMELKDFRSVSVYATGSAGTIAVSLVSRDGVSTSLVTLGVANFGGDELSLNLPNLTDYIGLEFTLTADSGNGPTLLGYQLRALPAPKRQRLIQVPLALWDEEVVGNTKHGYRGFAWDRLRDLEEMERTSGVVQYQDFDLGETASVQIEKIQFQGRTNPRPDKNGFGGRVVVTMRKVA